MIVELILGSSWGELWGRRRKQCLSTRIKNLIFICHCHEKEWGANCIKYVSWLCGYSYSSNNRQECSKATRMVQCPQKVDIGVLVTFSMVRRVKLDRAVLSTGNLLTSCEESVLSSPEHIGYIHRGFLHVFLKFLHGIMTGWNIQLRTCHSLSQQGIYPVKCHV